MMSAHPRSRGEHVGTLKVMVERYGSSPLARGTQVVFSHHLAPFRLIPARAGNTSKYFTANEWYSAHPRSRGEHDGFFVFGVEGFGSSPLARGTHG